jgi:PAS domain S-box-containing protein
MVQSAEGPDGRYRLFEVAISPLSEDEAGKWIEVVRELPEQQEIAHGFQSAAQDVVHLIGAWSVPVILLDRDDRIRSWNRGAAALYGFLEEEATGQAFPSLVQEEAGAIPQTAGDSKGTRRYEARHRAKDGKVVSAIVTRTDLVGTDGRPEGAFLLAIDQSDSKALQSSLERRLGEMSVIHEIGEALQSAMDFDEILRSILIGATASQGLRFNRAFLLLVDERLDMLRGKVAIGPADPDEAHRIWSDLSGRTASLRDLLREFEPFLDRTGERVTTIVRGLTARLADEESFLIRALRSPGTVRVVEGMEKLSGRAVDPKLLDRLGVDSFAAVPLVAEGKPVGLLIADNAITKRTIEDEDVSLLELLGIGAAMAIQRARLTEELEKQVVSLEKATQETRANQERILRAERLTAIGEMAARVVHEIRNPLVAIGGFARSLTRNVPETDPKREGLQIIVDEVRRLEAIVRDALDYSRPTLPRIGSVDLKRLATEALDLLRFEMEDAGVVGAVATEEDLTPAAADRDQLFQAIVNIIRNAIHAMPKGGTLTVSLREIPGAIEMALEDTGVGIPPEVRAKIFEPFYTTKSTGSGLGLTIASQIVRDHRGEIQVESQPGSGTTVYIRIPTVEEVSDAENPGG